MTEERMLLNTSEDNSGTVTLGKRNINLSNFMSTPTEDFVLGDHSAPETRPRHLETVGEPAPPHGIAGVSTQAAPNLPYSTFLIPHFPNLDPSNTVHGEETSVCPFMFDFFTPTKPRNTHARSQSSPYLPTLVTDNGSDHSMSHQRKLPQPPALSHPPPYISPSPTQLPPFVVHDLSRTRPARSSTKLSDWFTGESEPCTTIIPSPTKERLDPIEEMTSSLPQRTVAPVGKQPPPPKPPIISRFSLFTSKQPSPQTPKTPADVHDAWHDLDVKTALAPSSPTDPSSPSAFKDLQRNAEGLLLRLQTAYKERSQVLHDALAEKETQAEECEGAEMKSRHLKLQLDDMTAKLAEQDKAMMDLVDQLAQEKMARRGAEDAARTIQANFPEDGRHTPRSSKSRTSTASDMSIASEDSAAESLFSRRGAASPTMSMSSVSTMNSPDSQSLRHHLPSSADQSQCPSGHTKASTPTQSSRNVYHETSHDSEAWNLVNTLTLENKVLKTRVGQLDNTVEDCLDMVKGLF
ncbi:MAG: hypothetical protein Q9169_007015 [Polycauliona sp. 2 TL-2023]